MVKNMFTQTVKERSADDKIRWWIDCGDVDDDIEGYAATAEEARTEVDLWAGFCPFAYVYIEDINGNTIDAYWAR